MTKLEKLKKIEDVFAVFHDGTIENWSGDKEKLCLKISCQYLAEILDEKFEYFYVELNRIYKLELLTYPIRESEKKDNSPFSICDYDEIFCEGIDICYTKTVNDYVEINCWQINETKNYVANSLLLNCESIKIFNEKKEEIPDTKLFEISDYYWGKF